MQRGKICNLVYLFIYGKDMGVESFEFKIRRLFAKRSITRFDLRMRRLKNIRINK